MPETGDAERLVVLLEARIRDFEKNMQKASGTASSSYRRMRSEGQSATRQMEADMVRSTGRINQALATTGTKIGAFGKSFAMGFVGPLAALLSFKAAVDGTKAALNKFGDIADKSAAAGVDPEFFQSLAYQAKLSGVEIDAVAGALASFAKNSGLAAEGKGRMVEALKALDPELLRNIQRAQTQEERIRLVADAIAKQTSQSKAAAIAAATLGDAGAQLVAAFQGGAAGIDATIAKAKALGLVVDRDVIARADELGDQFDTTSQIVDLKLKQAFVDLGPVLIWLSGLAADFASQVGASVDQLKDLQDQRTSTLEGRLKGIQTQIDAADPAMNPNPAQVAGIDTTEADKEKAAIMAELRRRAVENLKTQLTSKPPTSSPLPTVPGRNSRTVSDLNDVADGYGRVRDRAAAATVAIASGTDAVDKLKEQFAQAEDLAKSFASTLVGDLRNGQGVVESLGDAFSGLADQLAQMAMDEAIKGLFSALMGAIIPGGGAGAGSVVSKGLGGFRGFADGTANTGGGRGVPRGVVHGQEAVIPLPNGGRVPVVIEAPGAFGGSFGGFGEVLA